jgi:hypothetical protein
MVEEINALTPGPALVANQGWAAPVLLLGLGKLLAPPHLRPSRLPSWPNILIVTEKIRAVVCVLQGR